MRSSEGKQKLSACLSPGNVAKAAAAPVTVIVAMNTRFYEHLPTQFPHNPGLRAGLEADAARTHATAFRNSSLQGAYLVVAARLLGLDCGPMSGFDAQALDNAFFPDGRWRSNFRINLGYGDDSQLHPRGPRLDFSECATFL